MYGFFHLCISAATAVPRLGPDNMKSNTRELSKVLFSSRGGGIYIACLTNAFVSHHLLCHFSPLSNPSLTSGNSANWGYMNGTSLRYRGVQSTVHLRMSWVIFFMIHENSHKINYFFFFLEVLRDASKRRLFISFILTI